MQLDTVKNEYYIEEKDVTDNTFYQNADLARVFGASNIGRNLKIISHAVYRLIYEAYRGIKKADHITFMRTKISNNTNGEQTFLMNAMIELVRGAIESGSDLNAYIENPRSIYPETVYEELRNGFLLDAREKILS